MEVLEAIKHRREITAFKPDPIPSGLLNQCIEALYLSPSGNNLPSREFILITDRDKLRDLTSATPFMKWLEQAAAAVAIISNPAESKYWLLDSSIAGGYLWLTATSLGLGAAWGAIYHSEDQTESEKREQYVRDRLNIPEHYRIVTIIGLGYPAHHPPAKAMYPKERVLHLETYRH